MSQLAPLDDVLGLSGTIPLSVQVGAVQADSGDAAFVDSDTPMLWSLLVLELDEVVPSECVPGVMVEPSLLRSQPSLLEGASVQVSAPPSRVSQPAWLDDASVVSGTIPSSVEGVASQTAPLEDVSVASGSPMLPSSPALAPGYTISPTPRYRCLSPECAEKFVRWSQCECHMVSSRECLGRLRELRSPDFQPRWMQSECCIR